MTAPCPGRKCWGPMGKQVPSADLLPHPSLPTLRTQCWARQVSPVGRRQALFLGFIRKADHSPGSSAVRAVSQRHTPAAARAEGRGEEMELWWSVWWALSPQEVHLWGHLRVPSPPGGQPGSGGDRVGLTSRQDTDWAWVEFRCYASPKQLTWHPTHSFCCSG